VVRETKKEGEKRNVCHPMMGNKKVKEVDCFFVETGREDHLKLFS
jgi:hypothetical protein